MFTSSPICLQKKLAISLNGGGKNSFMNAKNYSSFSNIYPVRAAAKVFASISAGSNKGCSLIFYYIISSTLRFNYAPTYNKNRGAIPPRIGAKASPIASLLNNFISKSPIFFHKLILTSNEIPFNNYRITGSAS